MYHYYNIATHKMTIDKFGRKLYTDHVHDGEEVVSAAEPLDLTKYTYSFPLTLTANTTTLDGRYILFDSIEIYQFPLETALLTNVVIHPKNVIISINNQKFEESQLRGIILKQNDKIQFTTHNNNPTIISLFAEFFIQCNVE